MKCSVEITRYWSDKFYHEHKLLKNMELKGRTHEDFSPCSRDPPQNINTTYIHKDLVSVTFSLGKKNYGVKYDVYVYILRL
jgi:hypothetical protein